MLACSERAYTAAMLDRDACERRVYRLAALLTGNPLAATGVIAQVVDAQPDLRALDGAHMDRLTVLRSRDIPAATLVSDLVPTALSTALASLTPQQREAFVFARVFRTPMRETARAMDCSVTAIERHLHQADESIAMALGQPTASLAQTLLSYTQSLEVPAFYRNARLRRRGLRKVMIIVALTAGAVVLAAGVIWVARGAAQVLDREPARSPASSSPASRLAP
jgi:hypothetical protein